MILTGKQKSYLRGLAQTIRPMFQIGKDGLTPEVITAIQNYITKNELGKISVLDTCSDTKEELAEKIAALNIQVVQIIGNNLVLFKRNHKLEDGIKLPR
ncbi:MAG: ribosome assembly RNA-binding protein YhbY [Tenericutes bacterium HGW-Tenericutes-1]|jgi:RNA-binding protein|nr:MAG: ribosome assembly RNA-binding protein YhbY [Tenericutes bacterium HGW-Tenericutes-1]